jgi:hypothetical protein
MIRTIFLLISLYMGLVSASAQSNKYDLNEDGDVNVTDVTLLVKNILDQNNGNGYDLNEDGDVNITDVILLVNYILGQNNGSGNGSGNGGNATGEAIDLGLPSGTKWASCNVGATKPEEFGGYYAWGETEEKECYNSVTYLYSTGVDEDGDGCYDDYHIDTFCYGIWQNLGDISGTEYDVAHVEWGGNWCMPTWDDIQELLDYCNHVWTTLNGVNGYKFTGSNGNSIFLPAAGLRWDYGLDDAGSYGDYWSSTQFEGNSGYASLLYFGSDYAGWDFNSRGCGFSVRPVWKE